MYKIYQNSFNDSNTPEINKLKLYDSKLKKMSINSYNE